MRDFCRHVKYTLADILEDVHEDNDNTLLPDDEKAKAESYMMASSTIILPRRPYIVSFFFILFLHDGIQNFVYNTSPPCRTMHEH